MRVALRGLKPPRISLIVVARFYYRRSYGHQPEMSRAETIARERYAVPADLASARAKLVYLYLRMRGEADVEEMSSDLGLPLITLCDLLDTLEDRGIVSRDADRFWCGD